MEKRDTLTAVRILVNILLATVIIGGGAYLYQTIYKTKTPSRVSENTVSSGASMGVESIPDKNPESVLETTDKKEKNDDNKQIYKNEEYGFAIKYPEDFELGGPNPEEKLLFSLSGPSKKMRYEFWIRELNGKTLEEVFEKKLNLKDISYFDWIRDRGGEISSETIGDNEWLFVDGSNEPYLDSHYMVLIPKHDAYLVVDLGFPTDSELPIIKNILATLKFTEQ